MMRSAGHCRDSGVLAQAQLRRVLFPLGPLTKAMVRRLAAAAGLATQARKDSQGICFLGKARARALPLPDTSSRTAFDAVISCTVKAGFYVGGKHHEGSIMKMC